MKNGEKAAERIRVAAEKAKAVAAASRRRKAPLRKIVERDEHCEKLECGHELRPPRGGLFGPTHPARRRCLECLDAQEGS